MDMFRDLNFKLSKKHLFLISASSMMLTNPAHAQDAAETDSDPNAIVVTATRREVTLDKVPLKIDALNQAQMDQRGIRSIDDISRFTPGLQFTSTGGVSGNTNNNISIRGISSEVGSATTAIYIDDTPIQIRNIGYFGSNPYPRVFDLDRVEVLKGPQGTLFGASAEGGAVRFITAGPSFERISVYSRAEIATTENGAPSYEAGAAVGAPIISDRIGIRLSGSVRRDGGYIDRMNYDTGEKVDGNANWERTYVLRGALGFKPTETLTVTPSLFFQKQYQAERSQYWENISDIGDVDYRSGNTNREPRRDRFYIPAIKTEWDMGGTTLVSNTSWFDRRQNVKLDYTNYLRALRTGEPLIPISTLRPSGSDVTTKQRNFTQEVRVQSNPGGPLDWVLGAYYSNQRQLQLNVTSSSNPAAAVDAFSLRSDVRSKDEQLAAFANVDFHATDKLTLTAGLRWSEMKFSFSDASDGPVNGGPSFASGKTKEHPLTPKFGIAYQANPSTLLYANAAKGFRQGGAQGPVPAEFCGEDLASLGLTQGPGGYDSDSVWSFDGGTKAGLFGGRVNIDANVYWIKWKNIQQPVNLPNCGFQFIANMGEANSRGIDLVVDFKLSEGVRVGANVGYNNTTFSTDVIGAGGNLLAADGDRIGGPRWTGTGWGEANFPLTGDTEGYVRADATFRSGGPSLNPATFSYDPDILPTESSVVVSARAGVKLEAIDLSLFVNNLFNANEFLSRTHDTLGTNLFYGYGYRPRTVGLTLTYHK
jgi:outer membrane receptor protein involved in Fe transport